MRQTEPFNAGPPPAIMTQAFTTPTPYFFVRTHGTIPQVDAAAYRLSVNGLVNRSLTLSLDDLKNSFEYTSVVATIQCAGNRRAELAAVEPIVGEVGWDTEAVSTCRWGGVRLSEVLQQAGLPPTAGYVCLHGLDEVQREGQEVGYGCSIDLAKALGPEVLLAYEMNGEVLPTSHGFPVRLVVPGYIGARSVKWLASITLTVRPSDHYFQTQTYKLYPPPARRETFQQYEDQATALDRLFLTSAISQPEAGQIVAAGSVKMSGYAIASEGYFIERVEVSADSGQTWQAAEVPGEAERWAWRLWQTELELAPGLHELVVRAWDNSASAQPSQSAEIWNFKGYMNNAWHRVRIEVVD